LLVVQPLQHFDFLRARQLGNLGFYIVGILVLSWLVSTVIYRVKKYEQIDVKRVPTTPTPTPTPTRVAG